MTDSLPQSWVCILNNHPGFKLRLMTIYTLGDEWQRSLMVKTSVAWTGWTRSIRLEVGLDSMESTKHCVTHTQACHAAWRRDAAQETQHHRHGFEEKARGLSREGVRTRTVRSSMTVGPSFFWPRPWTIMNWLGHNTGNIENNNVFVPM